MVFSRIEEFFETVSPETSWGKDLTPYFEQKSEHLRGLLFLFTKKYDELEAAAKPLRGLAEKGEPDQTSPPYGEKFSPIDEDLYLEIYKEMLSEKYEPPFDNLVGLQAHLMALSFFYQFARPKSVDFAVLLKFDISSMQVIALAMMLVGNTSSQVKKWQASLRHKRSNKGHPKSPLTEAVKYFFNRCLDEGHKECLKKGNILEFLKELKKATESESDGEYLGRRIKKINVKTGTIKTQDQEDKQIKSATYQKGDVSKILTRLRKEQPLT